MKNGWPGLHIINAEKEEKKQKEELHRIYRSIFLHSEMGQTVLADILHDLGVDSDIDPNIPAANALRNYALTVLLPKCNVNIGDTRGLVSLLAYYTPENNKEE